MGKYNFGKVDKDLLESNFIKALKDKDFVSLVNSLSVSDEIRAYKGWQKSRLNHPLSR